MPAPSEVQREGFRWLPTIIIGAIIAGAGLWALIQFGFAVDTANVHHQGKVGVIRASQNYQITQHSKAYQDGQIGIVDQRIQDIEGAGGLASQRAALPADSGLQAGLRAQELNVIDHMCTAAQSILPGNTDYNSGSPSDAQIVAANCVGGQATANPPLAANPVPHGGA